MNKKSTKKIVRKTCTRTELVSFLDSILKTDKIRDYSCNGLQVQGSETIKKIGLLVDACMEGYRLAIEKNCQLVIAHHGIIWDGIKTVSGNTYTHIKYLLENDLNLYASHLPLDLHPELGNNAQLAAILSMSNLKPFGNYKGIDIGFEGQFKNNVTIDNIVQKLCQNLQSECMVLPFGKKVIKRVAVVSGGAADLLSEAISKGIDCYITGESAHYNYHEALENKINVVFAGHYHTEKPGVQALGKVLEEKFGIESEFIDIPTPI